MLVVAEEGPVATSHDCGESGGGTPGLHEDVGPEREVEVEEEFLPDEGDEVVGADEGVGVVDEGLEEGENHGRG